MAEAVRTGFKVRVVGCGDLESPKTYIVATDDPEKAGDLAVIEYASKVGGEFAGCPYDGPELAGMSDGEIREIREPESLTEMDGAGKQPACR